MKRTYIKPDVKVIESLVEPLMVESKWGEKEEGSDTKLIPGGDGSELDSKENKGVWSYDDEEW